MEWYKEGVIRPEGGNGDAKKQERVGETHVSPTCRRQEKMGRCAAVILRSPRTSSFAEQKDCCRGFKPIPKRVLIMWRGSIATRCEVPKISILCQRATLYLPTAEAGYPRVSCCHLILFVLVQTGAFNRKVSAR